MKGTEKQIKYAEDLIADFKENVERKQTIYANREKFDRVESIRVAYEKAMEHISAATAGEVIELLKFNTTYDVLKTFGYKV